MIQTLFLVPPFHYATPMVISTFPLPLSRPISYLGNWTMLAKLERRVGIAQRLEEHPQTVQQDLVVGGEDDVGYIAGRGPGLQGESVPVVEGEGGDAEPLPLVAQHEGGNGQGFAAVVCVPLGGHACHPAQGGKKWVK
jgi:hypothetical protein